MRLRRGITLIEFLVAITIVAILMGAISRAFIVGLNYESSAAQARERNLVRDQFEENLRDLFRAAYLSQNQADTTTYFIGSNGDDSLMNSSSSNSLTFTIQGQRLDGTLLASTDDFETVNQRYGPAGGITEIELSTTPVGDAGTNEGLFIRRQTPSDSEPTQGGTERVFDAQVNSISFEFWDGTTWQPTWSTQVGAVKRLPAAIRVTYTLTDDEEGADHIFTVRLPMCDVTANDPADQTGTGGTQ